jgi:hypothetical protein
VLGIGRFAARVPPNLSLKGRSNGGPPGPGRRYAVHFRQPGPGVPPSASPLAHTLGLTFHDQWCATISNTNTSALLRASSAGTAAQASYLRQSVGCKTCLFQEPEDKATMQGNANPKYPASFLAAPMLQLLRSASLVRSHVMPNPSFKRTPNGVSRSSSSAGASPHFALAAKHATP